MFVTYVSRDGYRNVVAAGMGFEVGINVMKVAIPNWRGRVSPVFDVAGNVLVVAVDAGVELSRHEVGIDVKDPRGRAARLAETGADVLVCGAISRPLEVAVSAAGIEVIPQICGDVDRVLAALIDGRLDQGAFLMPGCVGRDRCSRKGRRRGACWPDEQEGGDGNAQR